jgi:hypothetical protein
VKGWTTNTDTYECPADQSVTNWMAVADDAFSATLSFTSTSDAYFASPWGDSYLVTTTNRSSGQINIRVVSSCTDDLTLFPYITDVLCEYAEEWPKVFSSATGTGKVCRTGVRLGLQRRAVVERRRWGWGRRGFAPRAGPEGRQPLRTP